jgi:hypothetical protein
MRIVAVAAFTALTFLQVAGTQVAAQEPAEPLLADIVSLFFPGYIVVSPGDLNPAIVRRAAADPAYDGAGRTPTVIRADLDGNGVADYAILVREDHDDQPDAAGGTAGRSRRFSGRCRAACIWVTRRPARC